MLFELKKLPEEAVSVTPLEEMPKANKLGALHPAPISCTHFIVDERGRVELFGTKLGRIGVLYHGPGDRAYVEIPNG